MNQLLKAECLHNHIDSQQDRLSRLLGDWVSSKGLNHQEDKIQGSKNTESKLKPFKFILVEALWVDVGK